MRRPVFTVVALVVLAYVPAAAAHVEVAPERVAPGSANLFELSTPNETEKKDVVGLVVRLPKRLILNEVRTHPGWQARIDGRTITWTGGRIPPRQFTTFALMATVPEREATLTLEARELFSDGSEASYRPSIDVVAGAAENSAAAGATAGRDSGARTLGTFALGIAIGALGLATLLGFALLALWLIAPWEKAARREPPAG